MSFLLSVHVLVEILPQRHGINPRLAACYFENSNFPRES
jgi:hypothetical protein